MNYRHAYHAGNHGDVLKHAVLARVLTYMTAKPKPLALLDAHAGIGRYDLSGVEAFKTGEWADGIGKVMEAKLPEKLSDWLDPYLNEIRSLNPGGGTKHYPGSPELAQRLLRKTDRLIFNELHPDDRNTLTARYQADTRIRISGMDALQAIKAQLPFAERRGIVLIDPAYEVSEESDRVALMVQHALRRMAAVTIMVWYPVTTAAFADQLLKHASEHLRETPTLDVRLMLREPHKDAGLAGSGLIIMNPPYTLHDELVTVMPVLAGILGKGHWGKGSVRWLTPPK
jgi:23S rRNA (adenine2030-N6)-methyltransferase